MSHINSTCTSSTVKHVKPVQLPVTLASHAYEECLTPTIRKLIKNIKLII